MLYRLAILLFLFASTAAEATSWIDLFSANELYTDTPNARAAALGDAGTAVITGAAAAWWNPSSLSRLTRWEATLESYHNLPEAKWLDATRQEVAIAAPLGDKGRGVALSMDRYDWGTIPIYDDSGAGHVVGHSQVSTTQTAISMGWTAKRTLDLGLTAKWIHVNNGHSIVNWEDAIGNAYALDAGTTWRPQMAIPSQVALVLANLSTNLKWNRVSKWPVPTYLRMGYSATPLQTAHASLTVVAEARKGFGWQEYSYYRLTMNGEDAYWDNDGNLTNNPIDEDGYANRPAYGSQIDWEPLPRSLVTSWFRQGVREELKQATYHIGLEYTHQISLPISGLSESIVSVRGGRLADPSRGRRSWTWGLGLELNHLQVDYSMELQGPLGRTTWIPVYDHLQRLTWSLKL